MAKKIKKTDDGQIIKKVSLLCCKCGCPKIIIKEDEVEILGHGGGQVKMSPKAFGILKKKIVAGEL
jgi:hypothetical protein